ncbi:MAG: ABC transporter substrate-binding protein [Alphaproteobacteria bacterium]|nr:ABC transporter substrate-binding protein [Alphaproteobacteria bacterium]
MVQFGDIAVGRRALRSVMFGLAVLGIGVGLAPLPVSADTAPAKIAVAVSLTGPNATVDREILDAVRMAVAESNATSAVPQIDLTIVDDHGTEDGAREAARQIAASDALMVVGPGLTTLSVVAGPIYAEAGLASIVPTAYGDAVTANPTTFRPLFSTSEMGEALANYLSHVLGGTRAVVIFKDSAFGRPVAEGFKRAATRLGITVNSFTYANAADGQKAAQGAAAVPGRPAIILVTLFDEAMPVLTTLRRAGVTGPFLGTSTIATDSFARLFTDQPEERQRHGFFTDGVYAATPMILDSAGADTLAFADRFRQRYDREPTWRSMQAFDAAHLAVAAARTAMADGVASDIRARRDAARGYLATLDGPAHALSGVTGPLWFTSERGRLQTVRIGRFHGGLFESAPLQLVPVSSPDPAIIANGAVVDMGSGHFARRQQVVYSGVYLNEIQHVDVAQSTFTADFYLWLRFGRGAGPGAAEPTDIEFPDMVRGSFDAKRTADAGELDDGSSYRLWRVRGDFKADFDLRSYPSDQQTLAIRFFNARAASDRLVYVQDRWSSGAAMKALPPPSAATPTAATLSESASGRVAAIAFRNLSQWKVLRASESRDILVTASALGDPRLVGLEGMRELSGFSFTVDIYRRILPTLSNILLPVGLLSLMMFVTLFFPAGNVMPRVATMITGALTGSVLLSSTNAQLGNVGYVVAVEYVFYLFFILCLVCLVTVVTAERLRATGNAPRAAGVERVARWVFFLVCAGAAAGTGAIVSG